MISAFSSYWMQSLALGISFGLLVVKMICKVQDDTVDAVIGALIAFAVGSVAVKARAAKVAEKKAETTKVEGGTDVTE